MGKTPGPLCGIYLRIAGGTKCNIIKMAAGLKGEERQESALCEKEESLTLEPTSSFEKSTGKQSEITHQFM